MSRLVDNESYSYVNMTFSVHILLYTKHYRLEIIINQLVINLVQLWIKKHITKSIKQIQFLNFFLLKLILDWDIKFSMSFLHIKKKIFIIFFKLYTLFNSWWHLNCNRLKVTTKFLILEVFQFYTKWKIYGSIV